MTAERDDAELIGAVIEYLSQPPRCFVPVGDFLGAALAIGDGFTPTHWPDAPNVFGYTLEDKLRSSRVEHVEFNEIDLECSRSDAVFYDGCVLAAKHFLSREEPLPPALADFVSEVLDGLRERPRAKRGRSARKNVARDAHLIGAIQLVLERRPDMRATRNDSNEPHSAIDVVVKAIKTINTERADRPDRLPDHLPKSMSYKRLKTIWETRKAVSWLR